MRSVEEIHRGADALFAQFDHLVEEDRAFYGSWEEWNREHCAHARRLAEFFYKCSGLDGGLHDQCERLYQAAEEMADFLAHQTELAHAHIAEDKEAEK